MHSENKDQICYPFNVDHLPEYFYEKAKKELNETPETREVELQKLKKLLSDDKLTSGIEFEEDFLHLFLRHRKYNNLKAFQYLKKYINFRRSHSNMFQSVPYEHFKDNPSTKFHSLLPYRCPEGCAIIFCEFGKWNPVEFPMEYLRREAMATYLQLLRHPISQISGIKIIYDFEDTMKHMRYCTPHYISLLYNASFNCIPARFKELHFINKSAFLSAIWAVVKHILPEKIRKRAFFHSNPEDILIYFPRSVIPTKIGGILENYHDAELMWQMNMDHGNCPEGGQPNYC